MFQKAFLGNLGRLLLWNLLIKTTLQTQKISCLRIKILYLFRRMILAKNYFSFLLLYNLLHLLLCLGHPLLHFQNHLDILPDLEHVMDRRAVATVDLVIRIQVLNVILEAVDADFVATIQMILQLLTFTANRLSLVILSLPLSLSLALITA